MNLHRPNLTPTICSAAKEALMLIREGYSPSDAIDLACKNVQIRVGNRIRGISAAERRRVEEIVSEDDPRQ